MERGKSLRVDKIVESSDSAAALGSGLLDVFSTPAMVALMEKSAHLLAKSMLPDNQDTVGTELLIKHLRATPVGASVYAEAVLVEIDGRRLDFKVTAYDNKGEIGSGRHTRFIIDPVKFMNKLN
jgi:predicted thioesterase